MNYLCPSLGVWIGKGLDRYRKSMRTIVQLREHNHGHGTNPMQLTDSVSRMLLANDMLQVASGNGIRSGFCDKRSC